jgi:hypothetical protein
MLTYTYVDNSNLFIEGQRVSAVKNKIAKDIFDAMNRKVVDTSWNIDYGRLHELVCGNKKDIGCANLWGSPWVHPHRLILFGRWSSKKDSK